MTKKIGVLVDELGHYVGDFLDDMQKPADLNLVGKLPPDGLFDGGRFDFDAKKWVEALTPEEIEERKNPPSSGVKSLEERVAELEARVAALEANASPTV